MLAKPYYQLTGRIQNKDYFQFFADQQINLDKLHDVLKGKLLGTIFHNAIPSENCRIVADNFWNNEIIKERKDGVPAISIGAYHYQKTLTDYFHEINTSKKHTENLFVGTDNFINKLVKSLTTYFSEKNINFRLAKYLELEASPFVMRSCHAASDFVILPHEDVAQCRTEKQKGFEIEKVPNYEMVALNICIENHNDGELHIWNIQPDDEARKILNISETGYPYPSYLLTEINKIICPIQVGDLYCFNGRNIHAVKSKMKSDKYRTTITFFMGYIDDQTIIYWT